MLYITWEHPEENLKEEEWKEGEWFPIWIKTERVIMISATEEELKIIQERFSNLPIFKGPYVRWTGEFARFIYENMKGSRR